MGGAVVRGTERKMMISLHIVRFIVPVWPLYLASQF